MNNVDDQSPTMASSSAIEGDVMSLMHAYDVVGRRADYTRTDSGWRAEFRGPITVSVEATDLESCRRALFAAVDARVAAWLAEEPGAELKATARRTTTRQRR